MKKENLTTLKIHDIPQDKFDREQLAGNLQPNEIYLTPAPDIDKTPQPDSPNLITSGGVHQAIEQVKAEAGVNFTTDKTLTLKDGVLSVNTTTEVEEDNTLPITSAAVASTVGNIEILLKTI